MLVPRLPQDALDVNVECDGKAKQLYSLCDQPLGAPICLFFIILILTCFSLILPDVNYGIMVDPPQKQLKEYHYTGS